jgi:hypothetical protein
MGKPISSGWTLYPPLATRDVSFHIIIYKLSRALGSLKGAIIEDNSDVFVGQIDSANSCTPFKFALRGPRGPRSISFCKTYTAVILNDLR